MKGYLDAKELESYKKEDLQELAKQLGVDAEGTKKEIAARCAAVEVDIPDDSELTEEDKKGSSRGSSSESRRREKGGRGSSKSRRREKGGRGSSKSRGREKGSSKSRGRKENSRAGKSESKEPFS
jgi:hypothetical protein